MPQLIHWSDLARSDLRAIDREAAMEILSAVARLVKNGAGDVSQLRGFRPARYRLRVGDWRVVFRHLGSGAIQIIRVGHRSQIYR